MTRVLLDISCNFNDSQPVTVISRTSDLLVRYGTAPDEAGSIWSKLIFRWVRRHEVAGGENYLPRSNFCWHGQLVEHDKSDWLREHAVRTQEMKARGSRWYDREPMRHFTIIFGTDVLLDVLAETVEHQRGRSAPVPIPQPPAAPAAP